MRNAGIVVLALAMSGMTSCATRKPGPAEASGSGATWSFEIEDRPGHRIVAPRITAFLGQRFNVSISDQKSYVADFEVGRGGAADVANPVIETVRDALNFEGIGRLRADGAVELDFTVSKESPVEPFAEETRSIGGVEVRVQRPEVLKSTTHAVMRLAPGNRVAIAAVPRPDGAGLMTLWGEVALLSPEQMSSTPALAPR
jgi:hypothetical protein